MQYEQAALEYRANYQPTKLQKKALGLINKNMKKLSLRAYFARFAVKTRKYSRLNNPCMRDMGAALCIFSNYLRMRQRKAFQRLRANAAQVFYRNFAGAEASDRDYLLQQTRTLLSTNLNAMDSSQHLEEALMSVLQQSLAYLQKQMSYE